MILDELFQFLKTAGVTSSHAAFSTDYLGHSPRYYDYLRCSFAMPSLRSLLKLAMRLNDIAQTSTGCENEAIARELANRVMACALTRCR